MDRDQMIRTTTSTETLPAQWAPATTRNSRVVRWAMAAFAGLGSVAMLATGAPHPALYVLILVMAAVSWAMIHHRSIARCLPIDRIPVRIRTGETVIRSSMTSQSIMLVAALMFIATGVFFVWGYVNGVVFTSGTREIPAVVLLLLGGASVATFAGAILVHTVMIAMNPENRAVSVRVNTDGITLDRGFHRHMRWDQVISIEPIEEQKTSLIPSYSIRIAYREDPTGSGRRSVRVRRYTWHGIWISTDPVATLHALHTYWSRPDLRSELGTQASITRFTEPTPLSDGNRP
ncbi:hypothetical protein BDB13_6170 [Rhodococcus sp. OK302]|nr:hypothetical protein BDB13_6170 [Rhodococcus sp. OK302]